MPSFGQFAKPIDPESAESKKARSDWEGKLINSIAACKGRGELPGGLAKLVEELVNPKVPWQDILRSWLREQAADDWDWLTPAMEYDDSGFILPSLKSERVGTVVFATDTSGSTMGSWAAFQAEKQACLDDLRPSCLLDIYCDSAIQDTRSYTPGERIRLDVPGGGGTDFRPVFKAADKLTPLPKCLVYLTDLDGTFPDEPPPYPVIWVVVGESREVPFGEVVAV
jgi:predicted metal-dependent peptidase